MSTINCADPYNCEYYYFVENDTPVVPDTIVDEGIGVLEFLVLLASGMLVMTQFGLLGLKLAQCTNLFDRDIKPKIVKKLDNPDDKKLKIIRGVPGVGKRSYVYYLEEGLNRNFVICDWNDYFIKNNQYKFNGKKLAEAEADAMDTFLSSIQNSTKRIYVIGTFPKRWMYDNYIKIAKMHDYEVDITELECSTRAELEHFNKRSVHSVPMTKSVKIFDSWEKDDRTYTRPAFLEDGVSIGGGEVNNDTTEDTTSEETPSQITNITTYTDRPWAREIKYIYIHTEEVPRPEISKEEISNEEVSNEEVSNEVISKEELSKEEISNEEVSNEEISKEEVSKEECEIDVTDNTKNVTLANDTVKIDAQINKQMAAYELIEDFHKQFSMS